MGGGPYLTLIKRVNGQERYLLQECILQLPVFSTRFESPSRCQRALLGLRTGSSLGDSR